MAQNITLQFEGDTSHLDRALRRAQRGLSRLERNSAKSTAALQGISRAAGSVSTALTAAGVAFAGFAATRGVQGIIEATTRFEQFRAQLTTYLGDQRLANAELQRLEKLATGLPQNVNDLTAAFVTLTRNGIDTSNESMKAFANIASANGKSVQQFAMAIEDAMRGEFERIKEFGIKVSKEGEKFVARFGDQIVATETSATRLSQSLVQMGQEGGRFFGAAERQANDLGTALSNLDASVEKAQRGIGKAGLAAAIQATANQITNLLDKNPQLIQDIGVGFTKAFLYAKEAAIILAKNIDIIGYTLAAVFGVKILTGILSFASAIAGPVVGAFVLLGKVLKTTALLAMRHPLIAGIAVVIGGISLLTDAIGDMTSKFLDFVGADEMLEGVTGEAKALGATITGYVNKGLSYTSDLQARVNQQAEEYRKAMEAVNETMDDADAAMQRKLIAEQKATELAESQSTLFKSILSDKYEELRVSGLTAEEQQLIALQKEAEQKVGRALLDDEKRQLQVLVERTKQQQRLQKVQERSKAIALDSLTGTVSAVIEEQKAINGVNEQLQKKNGLLSTYTETYKNHLGEIYDLEVLQQVELAQLRTDNARKIDDKIRQIETRRIRDMLSMNKTGIAQQLNEYDKGVLQRQGQEERQKQIVNDRIEFEKKSETEKTQWAISQAGDAFEALGKYNRQAFEASKALRIAEAIMNTYQAATLALATYPPPFNFIGAAAVVAMGLANVATIRSQQYTGRQLGGSVSMGESYLVGETSPEIFTPGASGRISRLDEVMNNQPVEVNFTINAVDAASVDELLVNRKGTIQQIISDAMLERGQRSRF